MVVVVGIVNLTADHFEDTERTSFWISEKQNYKILKGAA